MSKNNFKNKIKSKYSGRGNCWVKIPNDNSVYLLLIDFLNSFSDSNDVADIANYKKHIEREGFAWMRFSKPGGNINDPLHLFEVRFRGSKLDHKDSVIKIKDSLAKDLPLLGNTPFKLQLETENKKTVKEKVNKSIIKNSENKKHNVMVNKEFSSKEIKLTKPTEKELKDWQFFLRSEGLLSDDH